MLLIKSSVVFDSVGIPLKPFSSMSWPNRENCIKVLSDDPTFPDNAHIKIFAGVSLQLPSFMALSIPLCKCMNTSILWL